MNKKVFLILLVAVLTAGVAQAQFSVGARAGLFMENELMKVDGNRNVETKWTPGFQLGVVGEYEISEALAIQPGLLFAQTRFSYKQWWDKDENSTYNLNLNFLQIPINVTYKLDLGGANLLLQAGPYLSFGLGGSWKSVGSEEDYYEEKVVKWDNSGKIKFGEAPDNPEKDVMYFSDLNYFDRKPLDLGIGLGLGLQAGPMQFGLTYNIGLANLRYKQDDEPKDLPTIKYKANGLMFNATYFFGR